jgi:hypothetical protein
MTQKYDNKDIGDIIDKSFDAGYNSAVNRACQILSEQLNSEFVERFRMLLIQSEDVSDINKVSEKEKRELLFKTSII